jgi:hypothetical protein
MPSRHLPALALLGALAAGCASLPSQEMADARQAIAAADDAGAAAAAAGLLDQARNHLADAEAGLERGAYSRAADDALAAKQAAVSAREVTVALEGARETVLAARALGLGEDGLAALLARAERAASAPDPDAAIAYAATARQQGRLAISRHQLAVAARVRDRVRGRDGLDAEARALLTRLEAAHDAGDARRAYLLSRELAGALGLPWPGPQAPGGAAGMAGRLSP